VRLGGRIEVSPCGAAAGARCSTLRVDLHLVHLGQVDHQPVVDHGEPGRTVAAATDRDLESVLATEVHRRHDVFRRPGTGDRRRTAVDHAVPDMPSRFVTRAIREEQVAADRVVEQAPG
jgi:hypothetical protein